MQVLKIQGPMNYQAANRRGSSPELTSLIYIRPLLGPRYPW